MEVYDAIKARDIKRLETLLANGADIFAHVTDPNMMRAPTRARSDTPLQCACRYDFVEAIPLLIQYKADVNERNADGGTSLISVIHYQYATIVRALCDHGADVNAQDSRGNTALHIAAMCGSLEIAKELVSRGADTHAKNNEGLLAFHYSIREQSLSVLDYFLNLDPGFLTIPLNGRLAIHLAYNPSLLRMCILHGANVNAKDILGRTALHHATLNNEGFNLTQILVKYGADVNAMADNGATPFSTVWRFKPIEYGKRLLSINKQLDCLRMNGADPRSCEWDTHDWQFPEDRSGNTLLLFKTHYRINASIQLLVACKRFHLGSSGIALLPIDLFRLLHTFLR